MHAYLTFVLAFRELKFQLLVVQSLSRSKNASRNHTDIGWKHGTNVLGNGKKVKCNCCSKTFIGGIFIFKHHIGILDMILNPVVSSFGSNCFMSSLGFWMTINPILWGRRVVSETTIVWGLLREYLRHQVGRVLRAENKLGKETRVGTIVVHQGLSQFQNLSLVVILLNSHIAWTVIVFWFVFLVFGFVFGIFSETTWQCWRPARWLIPICVIF